MILLAVLASACLMGIAAAELEWHGENRFLLLLILLGVPLLVWAGVAFS